MSRCLKRKNGQRRRIEEWWPLCLALTNLTVERRRTRQQQQMKQLRWFRLPGRSLKAGPQQLKTTTPPDVEPEKSPVHHCGHAWTKKLLSTERWRLFSRMQSFLFVCFWTDEAQIWYNFIVEWSCSSPVAAAAPVYEWCHVGTTPRKYRKSNFRRKNVHQFPAFDWKRLVHCNRLIRTPSSLIGLDHKFPFFFSP